MTRAGGSRERILRAAAEVVSEHGYGGTTIARITERCGLPASSIYWFFEGKDELLAAVVVHHFEAWVRLRPPWRPVGPGEELVAVLDELLRPGVRALADSPDHLRLGQSLLLEPRERDPAARTRFLALRQEGMRAFEQWFVDALRARPGADEHDLQALAAELARLVVVATDGLFLGYRAGDELDPDLFLDLLLDTIAAALARGTGVAGAASADRMER
jgi:AcrR family transcriptional regulator